MNKKKILLINDLCGYGKVATAAMLPVLSYFKIPAYVLPTALVSNTLDYGIFNILDTTDYIAGVFPVWKQLGFHYDAIAVGFIASERQAQLLSKYCQEQATQGTTIFVDPIMGDEGKLYNGVTPATIAHMRSMVATAHLIFPNYTEACYLTENIYYKEGVTADEAKELLNQLHQMGAKSVLITSIIVNGQHTVAGLNGKTGDYFMLPYEEIPVHFPGTGDMFSAILIAHLLGGEPLQASVQQAIDAMLILIERNRNNPDKNMGIPVENYLHLLKHRTRQRQRHDSD